MLVMTPQCLRLPPSLEVVLQGLNIGFLVPPGWVIGHIRWVYELQYWVRQQWLQQGPAMEDVSRMK